MKTVSYTNKTRQSQIELLKTYVDENASINKVNRFIVNESKSLASKITPCFILTPPLAQTNR